MIIDDRSFAENYLMKTNYYRFTGYALQFRVAPHDSNYIDDVRFSKIARIYEFDTELRNVLKKWIEVLEIYFRTQISHGFAMTKCVDPPHNQHYDMANYYNKAAAQAIFDNFVQQKKYYKDTLILQHHQNKYGDKYPLWVITEMISFSDLSKLYSCMYISERDTIATSVGTGRDVLKNHLHCLSVLRNKCAHAARLYNTDFKPSARFSDTFLRKNPDVKNNSLFAYILVMIRRLPENTMKLDAIQDISSLIEKYNDVLDYHLMGFPPNFVEVLTNNKGN